MLSREIKVLSYKHLVPVVQNFVSLMRSLSSQFVNRYQLQKQIQVNLIITLSLGPMKTDRVISEPCYNEVIYNRHIAK